MSSSDALQILQRVERHTSAPIQIRSDAANRVERLIRYGLCIFLGAFSFCLFWWVFSPDTNRAWVFSWILSIISGWFGGQIITAAWRALPGQYDLYNLIHSCMHLLGRAPVMRKAQAYEIKRGIDLSHPLVETHFIRLCAQSPNRMISTTDFYLLETLTDALRCLPKKDPLHSGRSIGRNIRTLPRPEKSVQPEFHLHQLPLVFSYDDAFSFDLFVRIRQGVEHDVAEQNASILNIKTQSESAIEAPRRL